MVRLQSSSTQDDVAAALAAEGTSIYAWHGLTKDEFYWCIDKTLEMKPTLTLDDGADLIFSVHDRHRELVKTVIGGTEETTTACTGCAPWPRRENFSTRSSRSTTARPSGTSTMCTARASHRSTASCVLRRCSSPARLSWWPATAIAARAWPCAPAAWCQRHRHRDQAHGSAQGNLGRVPCHADGRGRQAGRHLHHRDRNEGRHRGPPFRCDERRRRWCGNTGHYGLRDQPGRAGGACQEQARDSLANEEYVLKNGVRVYILAQGRLVNLAAAEGHPSEVMDMSFANQYLALCKLARDGKTMKPAVYELSPEQDQELALIKLGTQGISIDKLTPEQVKYQDDYSSGT